MKRRRFITSVVGGATLGVAGTSRAVAQTAPAAKAPATPVVPAPLPPPVPLSPTGAFDVGSRAQLLIEPRVVHATERIAFTPHAARKHPMNPLLKADRPWEGWRINIYGTALYDEEEQLFKMWYVGNSSEWFPRYATYYATSRDGVNWEKPLIGTIKTPGLARHNGVINGCQIASITKDLAERDPARRYKMVEWSHGVKPLGGPHAQVSPDGLNWTRISTQNLFRSSDVVTAYYDVRLKQFVAFPKLSTPVRGVVRRCFGVTMTGDLLKWPDPRLLLQPDVRDDAGTLGRVEAVRSLLDVPDHPPLMRTEFYGLGMYQGESCTVGFPWVFSVNNNARYPTDRPTRNHEGPCDIQLAATRDLQSWERPFRTPVVPLGEPGQWDCGFLTTASQAFRHRDEIWLYYGGGNYTHGNAAIYDEYKGTDRGSKYTCSIGLAKWRLDRFVSADGGTDGGRLTTVPLHFTGRKLELNVDAKKGSVSVEVLDAAGKPLPGFGKSDPISSDSLRATVTWKGRDELGALAGRPISLRFDLRSAGLFSFAFRA